MLLLPFVRGEAQSHLTKPFTLDLTQYGYSIGVGDSLIADRSSISFVSDDRLLVQICVGDTPGTLMRSGGGQVMVTGLDDGPESFLIAVDARTGRVSPLGTIQAGRPRGKLRTLANGTIAVLNRSGLRVCFLDLTCGEPVVPGGRYFTVSPDETKIAIRTTEKSRQFVVLSETLDSIRSFPGTYVTDAVMGDKSVLLSDPGATAVYPLSGGRQPFPDPFDESWSDCKFITSQMLFLTPTLPSKPASVMSFTGRQKYGVTLESNVFMAVFTSRGERRFGVSDWAHKNRNFWADIIGFEDTRPYDSQRVRIFDSESGKLLFQHEWNPSPHIVEPALSPKGNRLAIVGEHGNLEIWTIN